MKLIEMMEARRKEDEIMIKKLAKAELKRKKFKEVLSD
jgi:hypothetical protein